jgi:hypothetical protein
MSLSTLTTTVALPLRGEPAVAPTPEEVLESYKAWAPATAAVARAINEEAVAFDVFISRIGPAIDAGLSQRETVRRMKETGLKVTLTFVDEHDNERRSERFPNNNDLGVWQAVWHLMRDGDVDAVTARKAMNGVNSTGMPLASEVRAIIKEASDAGRDVTKAVESTMRKAKEAKGAKAPAPFDADKTIKKAQEALALLTQHGDSLTPAQRGAVAGLGFTAQAIVG